MGKTELAYLAFNRGLVSPLGLARSDIKRIALAAERMDNWMPRVLGSMSIRPGRSYLGATASNLAARFLPFVFAIDDTALIEFTNLAMRIWISDVPLTRVAVSSAITNGNFNTNLTGWTDSDEGGGTSAWVTGGYMGLTGDGSAAAIRDQVVTVSAADIGKEHALRIIVQRGPVMLRVGTTSANDSYVNETALDTGEHSLAFTPTGDFNIRFFSRLQRQVLLNSCQVEGAGVVSITSAYPTADLGNIRCDQSGDIVFLACFGYQQTKVERRATRSWSLVKFYSDNGPFLIPNVGPTTMTPSVLSGNGTLTASVPFFRSGHVGALFSVTSAGQTVTASISSANAFTSAIRVTGVGTGRTFQTTYSGVTASGSTVTLQRSAVSATGPWTDVGSSAVDADVPFSDGLDNQILWYRLGVKAGAYGGGTQVCTLTYAAGSITGFARVTAVTSSTVTDIEVLTSFGAIVATDNWSEGAWSDVQGWPSSVSFYEGRLWWAGLDNAWGSESDAFYSNNIDAEGDSGPINRTIGMGPVEKINWMLPLGRLILGAQGSEFAVRSSSLDEPLTPTNCNIKPATTQGSAAVQAIKIDKGGFYVQRGGSRVFELSIDTDGDYASSQLTAIVPDLCKPSVVRMAAQRQPDTRIHFIRSDGVACVVVFDKLENVVCWLTVSDDEGAIEDVVVLPGVPGKNEDQVYYVVNRTINGSTVRYLEKWALEEECLGDLQTCHLADSFIDFSMTASSTVTGLTHLVGESVVVWADGKCLRDANNDIQEFTVNGSGEISLTELGVAYLATTGTVGLPYTAQWQSSKLLNITMPPGYTALNKHKQVQNLGVVMANVHPFGLKYGRTFSATDLMDLPRVEDGTTVDPDAMRVAYDKEPFTFPGSWGTDERLCLQASAMRPVTMLAAICGIER